MSKEMFEKNKTICFIGSGPKRLCGYNPSRYIAFIDDLTKVVVNAYKNGYTRFICGGNPGFDQLAFSAVNMVKILYDYNLENVLYLPFPEYGSRWSKSTFFGQNDLTAAKKKATSVTYVFDNASDNVPMKLIERNHAMVDMSDYVLASPSLSGVIGECVAYAVKHNKDVGYIEHGMANDELRICRCIKAYDKGNRLFYT